MKHHSILKIFAFVAIASLGISACTEDDTPVDPVDAVVAPTNLVASSDDGAIHLSWTLSASETQSNFHGYHLTIFDLGTNIEDTLPPVAAGVASATISGVTNGSRYEFVIRSVDDEGQLSSDFASITWSAAVRQQVDMNNELIRVYATTSTSYNSALDLYNAAGKAEVIPQAGAEFRDRGDLYIDAASSTSPLQIISPAEANNQGLETQFSSDGPYAADDLDNQMAADPPADGTYTVKEITIDDAPVTTGRVYFGRIVRGSEKFYFRLLVKKGAQGKLIQGSGIDRFLEFYASFQDAANNPFAKH